MNPMRISNFLFFILFFVFVQRVSAFDYKVTDSCKISLLTCTPGEELYSCFGHSGIRVKDVAEHIDVVFNYGTFDFDRPGFYVNFCRGILIYSLGVDDYRDFENQYVYEQRGLAEQDLNLTKEEKQKIADFLIKNAQPENRDYRYDFLLDNCATRIRDVFEKNTDTKLTYNFSKWDTTKTFRYLIEEYSWYKRWESFGMNLLIGLPVDKSTTPRQQMFLPDYLRDGFAYASIKGGQPFVSASRIILAAPEFDKKAHWTSPEWIFTFLLIAVFLLTLFELRYHFHVVIVDYLLLLISGLFGLLYLTLWTCTQHWTTAWNLNLLWALPTNIILAHLILFNRLYPKIKLFILVTLGIEVLFALIHALLPQPFQIGMVLINLTLVVRLFRLYYKTLPLKG